MSERPALRRYFLFARRRRLGLPAGLSLADAKHVGGQPTSSISGNVILKGSQSPIAGPAASTLPLGWA